MIGRESGGCLKHLVVYMFAVLLFSVQAARAANSYASPFVLGPESSSFTNEPVGDTGYVWGDVDPDDLGEVSVTYDSTGLRQLPALPAGGGHPRILFTASQLPDIRTRLQTTKVGQHMYNCVLGWTETLKGTYDNYGTYAVPDRFKGSFGTHGFAPVFRATCLQNGLVYGNYAAGITQMDVTGIDILWGLFALEGFRCLVDEDDTAGQELGQAVETAIIDYVQGTGSNKYYSALENSLFNVAYTYDLAYPWLSSNARTLLHDFLAAHTRTGDHYGSLEVAETTTSNWSTFTYALTSLLAIEGEAGFNDLRYLGYLRSFRNFFTYGWYESGACFEGMGKDQLGSDALVMFALRGEDVVGHPHMLNYYRNRLPKDILPGSDQFIAYDRWGGYRSPRAFDAMGLKYLYPNDPEINWVYRRAIGSDPDPSDPSQEDWFEYLGGARPDFYWNEALITAVFADDPDTPEQTREDLGVEKTFFCGERNLFITRSDWSDDALYLNFQARPVNGGHVFADRNTFSLTGKGENWFIKRSIAYDTDQNSVVMIDQTLQSRMTPARVVDVVDEDIASFVVGDAKYTWDWEVVVRDTWQAAFGVPAGSDVQLPSGGEWERVWETSNEFSYDTCLAPYLNIPVYKTPIWYAKEWDDWRKDARRPLLPVEKAYRTAGVVRGTNGTPSYALVFDDIQVDSGVHHYDWIGQVEDDTLIWKIEELNAATARPTVSFARDVYLFHPEEPTQTQPTNGQAALLVRFLELDSGSSTNFAAAVSINDVGADPEDPSYVERRLVVSTDAVSPGFKALLYPHIVGQDPLPVTRWNGSAVEISWPGFAQVDSVSVSLAVGGKEDITISRDTVEIAAMDQPVSASPNRTPDFTPNYGNLPGALGEWDFSTADGLIFTTGQYDSQNAKIDNGTLWFDGKGHQMVTLPAVQLPINDTFSVSFWVTTDKGGDAVCNIISDVARGWSFGLGYWNSVRLIAPDAQEAAPRWTEEEIDEVFINNWAHVVVVKDGLQWTAYVNGEPRIINIASHEIAGTTLQLDLGDAFGSVFYGMQGRIDNLMIFGEALSFQEVSTLHLLPSVVLSQPEIGLMVGANGALSLTGGNGVEGWPYRVLTATNLNVPPEEWTVVSTNYAGADGSFQNISLPSAGGTQAFFKIDSQ